MSGRSPRLISVSRGTPLADIAEGELIKLNESGSPVEFYVAKHDYEPELNGSGRTLLVRKDCYDTRVFSNAGNAFSGSSIDTWLNGTWLKLLDADIQTAVGTTKFYRTIGNGNSTVTTLERAVFLLSITEVGKSSSVASTEGTALSSAVCNQLAVAYLNGSAVGQWLRTPVKSNANNIFLMNANGGIRNDLRQIRYGSRPVFTLPSDFILTDDML